jgi:hypothetical protein
MTTHTSWKVVCLCGQVGALERAENDRPYSKGWEEYTLDGQNGYSVERFAKMADMFAYLQPTCPKCGHLLTVANIQR